MKINKGIEKELNLPVIVNDEGIEDFLEKDFNEGTLEEDYAQSRRVLKRTLAITEKIVYSMLKEGFETNARNIDALSNLLTVMNRTSVNVLALSEKVVNIYRVVKDDSTGGELLDKDNKALLVGTLEDALKLAKKQVKKELKNVSNK